MSSKSKAVFKKHRKLGKIYDAETGLVIKSQTEKLVIGRIVDDEFLELDEETVKIAEENGYKIDPSLIEDGDNNDQSSEAEVSEEAPKSKTEERKVSAAKSETKVETKGKAGGDLPSLLKKFTSDFEKALEKSERESSKRIEELEATLASTKKELEETKKKLKGVLAAMQNDL
jgi:septin family protein